LRRVAFRQPDDAQATSIAHLRMRLVGQYALEQTSGVPE
jgi:hypothetical protein